jgi:putative ABC transport system ATP-binding protein
VVEDGPTITHGGLHYGAGTVAAQAAGVGFQVDPRPYAAGSLVAVYEQYPHIGSVLPAMGYSDEQLKELQETINAAECDAVITGTPIDLGRPGRGPAFGSVLLRNPLRGRHRWRLTCRAASFPRKTRGGVDAMAIRVEPRPLATKPSPPFEPRESIVEARGVDKLYDTGKVQVHALRSVSFSVPRGEMVAIMGPSGSGKTTLLNCLSGLDRIDAGEVLIEGVSLSSLSDEERTDYRARRMGFVFQFYNLMPVLTAVENVELPLLVARVPAKEARRKALEALELVGLGGRADHVPDELSGGQRQRVTIARALVNDPAIVWADEPTGDLDSENAEEIVALMRQLNREHGLTFLIVTHDISVGRSTDRIVRMVDGEIVGEELLEVIR